jgi:uncharacterized protein DUF3501
MRPIDRGEIMGLADYETIRERFRSRVIQEKRKRRVAVGDRVSVVFENRDTVLLQIQEMLRTERITKESGIQHELDTYNQLVPGPHELSATVMIEIPEHDEREAFLERASGFEKHVALVVDGERLAARWEVDRVIPNRASAVLYVKFLLTSRAEEAIGVRRAQVELLVDHPVYGARTKLDAAALASIAQDLDGAPTATAGSAAVPDPRRPSPRGLRE